MDTFEKVLSSTKKGAGSKARKYNGVQFEDVKGHKGIYLGYVNQKDYWVYWYEERLLAHHYQQISLLHTLEGGSNNGRFHIMVDDQQHEQLWELRKEKGAANVDYSILDAKQLPGFVHCMELDSDYEPRRELWINLKDIIVVTPVEDMNHLYKIGIKDNLFTVYIPDHQFEG